MKGIAQKLLIGTSVLVGMTAIASAPALAGSLTGASVSGDSLTYLVNNNLTYSAPNNALNWQTALDTAGNVELGGYVGGAGTADFANATVLNGTVDGSNITLSSLTADDWFGTGNTTSSYGASDFANEWFNAALTAYSINDTTLALANSGYTTATLFDDFLSDGGFERFSDPNVESVEGDGNGGLEIVLAGHYDGTAQLVPFLSPQLQTALAILAGGPIQASEVVKVTYNGQTSYQYGFSATLSGVVDPADGVSHTGNYTLTQVFDVEDPTDVPEPSIILGLMTVSGLFAASKRKPQKA